jgi:hypothetical protein
MLFNTSYVSAIDLDCGGIFVIKSIFIAVIVIDLRIDPLLDFRSL